MINLVTETLFIFLTLFFLMPIMLIIAVIWHTVTDRKHKHGLWHKESSARSTGH
jgi:hypothetical protein